MVSIGEYQDYTLQLTETEDQRYESPLVDIVDPSSDSTCSFDYVVHPVRLQYLSLLRPSQERYSSSPYNPTGSLSSLSISLSFSLDDRYSLIYRLPSLVITPHGVATILHDDTDLPPAASDEFGSRSSHLTHVLDSVLSKNNSKKNVQMDAYQPQRNGGPNISEHDAPTEDHYKILSEFTDEGYGLPETNEEVQVRIDAESFHTTIGTHTFSFTRSLL